MKKIYSSPDVSEIEILCGLLADEGIGATVLNEGITAVSGDVPFAKAIPQVWVVNDEDEERALAIVERMDSGEARESLVGEPWKCPRCGEAMEGQFTKCWKCGTSRGDETGR